MSILTFDTEYDWAYSNGNVFDPRNVIVSIVVYHCTVDCRRIYRFHFYDSSVSNCNLNDIKKLFESNREALIVGHNVKVDIHQLDKLGIKHSTRYFDTMFPGYVQLEARRGSISLAALSRAKQDLGNLLVHKHKRQPSEIHPWWLMKYNVQDVRATWRLYVKQKLWLKGVHAKIKKHLLPSNAYHATIDLMNGVLPCIIEMEHNGFRLDRQEFDRCREEAYATRRLLERTLRKLLRRFWGIKYFKISSAQQRSHFIYSSRIRKERRKEWAHYFEKHNPFLATANERLADTYSRCFERTEVGLGVQPVLNAIRKNSLSSDRDTLKELIGRGVAATLPRHYNLILKLFYEISRLNTLIGTFLDGVSAKAFTREGEWWLNTSYNQCVARTGRLSSSNPNLHNWPRHGTFPIRRCVVSRFPGGKIAAADSSQLELRYGMWYYGDIQGLKDYQNGVDIHGAIAAQAYGDTFTEAQRTNTKSTVFRVWYRGTAKGILKDQKIPIWSLAEAEVVVDTILGRYVGVASGQEADLDLVKRQGYLDTPTGRRYRFQLDHFSLKFKVANYPIQGGATGDFIPCCMIVAYREFKRRELQSLLIGQVHDEILADVYPGEEAVVEEVMHHALNEGGRLEFNTRFNANFDFPLGSSFKIKKHW